MTYYEEKKVKAEAIVRFAEEGFSRSVVAVAKELIDHIMVDEVPEKLKRLLIEYEAIEDAREELERIKEYLAEREAKGNGC